MQSQLGGRPRDAQQFGDLGVGVALDLAQHEHDAQRIGQRRDRSFRLRGRGGDVGRRLQRLVPHAPSTPQDHERGAHGGPPDPRAERTALLIARERLGRPHEHVLEHVLRVLSRAEQPQRRGEDRRRMPCVQLRERLRGSAPDRCDQHCIVRVAHGRALRRLRWRVGHRDIGLHPSQCRWRPGSFIACPCVAGGGSPNGIGAGRLEDGYGGGRGGEPADRRLTAPSSDPTR